MSYLSGTGSIVTTKTRGNASCHGMLGLFFYWLTKPRECCVALELTGLLQPGFSRYFFGFAFFDLSNCIHQQLGSR